MTDATPTQSSNSSIAETATVIGIGNLKSVAEQTAMLANLSYANFITNTNLSQQNAVANQQAFNQLTISVLGKTVNNVLESSPLKARSAVDVLGNDKLADEIASLRAVIQAFGKPAA